MMTHSARSLHILGTSVPLSQAAVILFVLLALYICRVVFRSKADVGPTSALMNPALEGEITKLPTAWGDIYIRVFDPVKGGYSTSETTTSAPLPVVCLPGINAKLVDEWVPVAVALQQKGHFVIIINFHSNPATTPALFFGGFSDLNVQTLLRESVMGLLKSRSAAEMVLLGKSWGGKQAMQFAVSSPRLVSKLVLVAPASTDQALISALARPLHASSSRWTAPTNNHLPVLLAWAKDDRALWFSNSKVWVDSLTPSQLKLVTAEVGGHRILPEFTGPIVEFVTAGK